MKVAIYPRVSTQMQKEKGVSLDAQKSELIDYCNRNNYEYELFEEEKRNQWKKYQQKKKTARIVESFK